MKKIINEYKKAIVLILIMMFGLCANSSYSAPATAVKKQVKPTTTATQTVEHTGIIVDPVKVVENPSLYLNKSITFETEFIAFTSLGLDYKPAFRDGTKYIGILIQRSDVKDHIIPLSEMKIFLNRTNAEKYVDLEQGDKIKITGTVFSNALGDPWVEIKALSVVSKKEKKDK